MSHYTKEEIYQIEQLYYESEKEHGCGYWPVCLEHACYCSLDAQVSKGFDIAVWSSLSQDMHNELSELYEEFNNDDNDDW